MKTILVVEDTDDLRELFLLVLKDAGYHAVGAQDGGAALELLASMKTEPCLILLDMMMPEMNGRMLLQALHETRRVAALPVVVVSAVVNHGDSIEGARKVVRKPVSPKVLMELVREFCGPP
jgi:CheY-like chemotaxis protein